MCGRSLQSSLHTMNSTASLTSAVLTITSLAGVDRDARKGRTLAEWRRELDAARAAERRARRAGRSFRLPRLLPPRPAW